MFYPFLDRRIVSALRLCIVVFGCICFAGAQPCAAAMVAFLTDSRAATGERFEADLLLAGKPDMIGDEVELINLDIFNSLVNATPLTDFGRVRFDSEPRFAPWQDGQQFGVTPDFESVIVLDAFASVPVSTYPIVDTNPFLVGTFTFDYSGLGLKEGDTITLDLSGREDGTPTRTTSIAIRAQSTSTTVLCDPDFSSSFGSERSIFRIPTAIPEPNAATILALLSLGIFTRRRSKRSA